MTEMSTFEQRLAAELEDMAGPGRLIDATAMVRTVSGRSLPWKVRVGLGSARSGTARLVLVGAIVAVIAIFVVGRFPATRDADHAAPAAASESPEPTVSADPLSGLVTERIQPGVSRVLRDDAGHDLDERHPAFRYDLDRITITGDGTIWLQTTYHQSDNQAHPAGAFMWALGRPGSVAVGDGLVGDIVPLPDDSMLAIGDDVVLFDGTAVVPDEGQKVRPVRDGTLWLLEPDDLIAFSGGLPAGRPNERLAMIWDGERWLSPSELSRSAVINGGTCVATDDGVACDAPLFGNSPHYLAGTRINEVARAPDDSLWAVGSYQGEGGGLYRLAPE